MKTNFLKLFVLFGLALISFNTQIMAQKTKKYKIIKRNLSSEIINVSADSLWAIAKEFDKTAEWTSTLNHSYANDAPKHTGATCSSRTCETSFGNGNKVIEELVLFDEDKRELSYDLIEGVPGFITFVNNHWKIIEIGPEQCKLEMEVTMHMKKFAGFFFSAAIIKQMTKQVNIVLEELKIYAETGKVSEKKRKQLALINNIN